MDFLITIALIVFVIVGIIFIYKYCDSQNCYDPNTMIGRMENRYKREIEQWFYEKVFLPSLNALGIIIIAVLIIIVGGILYILGIR